MAEKNTNANLPAPLALTVDEACQVGGGYAFAATSVSVAIPNWLWFGRPPEPYVSGLQTIVSH